MYLIVLKQLGFGAVHRLPQTLAYSMYPIDTLMMRPAQGDDFKVILLTSHTGQTVVRCRGRWVSTHHTGQTLDFMQMCLFGFFHNS